MDSRFFGFAAVAILLLASSSFPHTARKLYVGLMARFGRLARRRAVAVVLVGVLAALGSAAVASFRVWPQPRIHDEFSHLLAADTFVHGRLANPTHPHWEHFETFHVFHTPVYASKYPPGQGLVLAIGVGLARHPLVGVWISVALLVSSICWMLMAWVPARWAVLGAVLALLQYGVASYWSQSYWGGALAGCGGALVFGALPRIVREARFRDAVALAVGLVILVNTRPFVGGLATLPALGVFLLRALRRPQLPRRALLARAGAPMLVVLLPALAVMLLYNDALTDDPFKLPYQRHDELYTVAPPFLWAAARPAPEFRHEVMRRFWVDWAGGPFVRELTPAMVREEVGLRLRRIGRFFVGPALFLPFLALPWVLRERGVALSLVTLTLLVGVLQTTTYFQEHYLAPATGLFVLLTVVCARRLLPLRLGGRRLGPAVVLACLGGQLIVTAVEVVESRPRPDHYAFIRAELLQTLERDPTPDLVLVRSGPATRLHSDWVYNGADIDSQPVVFAREMDGPSNARLVEYFHGRRVWVLDDATNEILPFVGARTGGRPSS